MRLGYPAKGGFGHLAVKIGVDNSVGPCYASGIISEGPAYLGPPLSPKGFYPSRSSTAKGNHMATLALIGYMVAAINGDVWYMLMFGGIMLMGLARFVSKPT